MAIAVGLITGLLVYISVMTTFIFEELKELNSKE